jgi:predicted metalloendopeptidase
LAGLGVLTLGACGPTDNGQEQVPERAEAALGLGIDADGMDAEVRPQDDLYGFVNGTWMERTEIPPDRSNYGAFIELVDGAEEDVHEIMREAAQQDARLPGSDAQKVGDFYRSFMDTARVEELGLEPLRPTLTRVDGIESREDLYDVMAELEVLGAQKPFGLWVSQDARAADRYITYLSQSGLGLPDRDYYFNEDERFRTFRDKYVQYVEDMLELAETPGAADAARRIMALETRLAENHWTRVENRDREKTYNKVTLQEMADMVPVIDWPRYLEEVHLDEADELIVRQPSYFEAMAQILAEVPLDDWKAYLRFKALDAFAPYLSSDLVETRFDFRRRTLSGVEENRDRWKRAVTAGDDVLGEILGRMYVDRHYRPEAKARMDFMVENLRTAFRQSIDGLEWMGDETKQQAQGKLAKFNTKIGYPEKWKDYSQLEIREDELLGNVMRSRQVEHDRVVKRLGQPVDRTEWFMTPQTVNAYYSPTMNEIVFPAAILQPPFFNVEADDAANYGAIGAVIGHEFSHGFDDQGRKSDGDGNLRDWWTEEDAEGFKGRAQQLVDQYAGYSPIEGMNVNGDLTLGENIGDLAGLTMAYRAYRLSLEGEEPPVIDGYTGDQRFFMGWTQVWRRKYREDELRRRLVTDPHSPAEYRANGTVLNIDAYHEAYGTQPDDMMWKEPADRVTIW